MVGMKVAVAAMLVAGLLAGCVGSGPAQDDGGRSRGEADAVHELGGRTAATLHAEADAQAGGSANADGAATEGSAHSATASFEVVPQNSTHDEAPWYLAAIHVPTGQAGLGGFRWTVPADAVHEAPDGHGPRGVSLEIAFLVPAHGTIGNYSVSWFVMDGETPTLIATQLGIPFHYIVKSTPLLHQPQEVEVRLDPVFLEFDASEVSNGTTLGIVVAAQGSASAFGVAWRVLDHNIAFPQDEPAANATEFLATVKAAGAGLALHERGAGAGFQATLYADLNLDFLLGIELAAGPVEVADSLPTAMARPTATVRHVSVSSQFAAPEGSPGGWGWAQQVYATLSGGAQWKVTGDVHGVPLDESGFASGAGYLNPLLLQTYGHDAPSSNVTLEATIVNADAIEILESVAVDYGAPIAHLLASHAPAEHPAHSSHASNGKAVAIEGGDLVLQSPGGPAIHLLGAGHIVQAR